MLSENSKTIHTFTSVNNLKKNTEIRSQRVGAVC